MDLNWGQLINEISRCAEIVIRRRMPWLPGESVRHLSVDIGVESATWLCKRQWFSRHHIPMTPAPWTTAARRTLENDRRPSLRRKRQ